jgi:hypothetical protein
MKYPLCIASSLGRVVANSPPLRINETFPPAIKAGRPKEHKEFTKNSSKTLKFFHEIVNNIRRDV